MWRSGNWALKQPEKTDKEGTVLTGRHIDGDSGKIYEFYARSLGLWDDMDQEQIVDMWRLPI